MGECCCAISVFSVTCVYLFEHCNLSSTCLCNRILSEKLNEGLHGLERVLLFIADLDFDCTRTNGTLEFSCVRIIDRLV